MEVVELFRDFVDAAKDADVVSEGDSRVAAADGWQATSFLVQGTLGPLASLQVKLPSVVQPLVIVVLTTENVKRAVMERGGVASARRRSWPCTVCHLDDAPGERRHVECVHCILSVAINEASEDDDLITV